MARYTPSPLGTLANEQAAVAKINENLNNIATALEGKLSRTDTSLPNHMSRDLDMNSNDVLNAGVVYADRVVSATAPPNPYGNSEFVNYTPAGTEAVQRTVQDKLREIVSVRDFGAVGDGSTDDTAAVQAAINFAQSQGKVCFFPAGRYVVGDLFVNGTFGTTGITIEGEHLGHVGPNATGSTIIYTGSGNCLSINGGVESGLPLYHYRTYIRNLSFWAPFTGCNALIFARNIQEGEFYNISVNGTNDTLNVQHGMLFDSAGIWNVDHCCVTRCVNGVSFTNAALVNSSGTFNLTRNNIYLTTNAVNLGLMDSFNARDNWIEGFQYGFLLSNASPNVRVQAYHCNIENNLFNQSTNGLSQTRAVFLRNAVNTNPIRLLGRIRGNFCYMDSSGSTKPDYAIEVQAAGNTATVDIAIAISENLLWGVNIAGVHSNDSRAVIYMDRNESRVAFSGARTNNKSGTWNALLSPAVLANITTDVAGPNNTSENVVATIPIPAGLVGSTGLLRIKAAFAQTGSGTAKIYRFRIDGQEAMFYDAGSSSAHTAIVETTVTPRSETAQFISSTITQNSGATIVQGVATTANTGNAVNLTVTLQKGVETDVMKLDMLLVEVVPR